MDNSHIAVPIQTTLFLELANFLKEEGSSRDPVDVVSTAIQYWIANASWKQEDLMPEVFKKELGYRWKKVFLPHGSKIRMKYKGQFHYAKVEGDKFVYLDQPMSPSEFAKKVAGGIPRNAWRDLEIRRPDDSEWKVADSIRADLERFVDEMDSIAKKWLEEKDK